ncbi:MAG: SH3 domain-containing protein [Anaerolineales bacterium]|nr:SH3 domain-containing protein [Anaerolineales bacterium]
MTSLIIPIMLTIAGLVGMIYTYSSIRRGGARVYSMEREIILRRATSALAISTLLFLGAVGLLAFQLQSDTAVVEEDAVTEPAAVDTLPEDNTAVSPSNPQPIGTPEPLPSGPDSNLPPLTTQTPTPTIDPNLPTATPTPVIIRAFVTGTSGSGLSMREEPGGDLIEILPEETFVTVVDEAAPIEQGGFTWIKIRTFAGVEGWAARQFLEYDEQ